MYNLIYIERETEKRRKRDIQRRGNKVRGERECERRYDLPVNITSLRLAVAST